MNQMDLSKQRQLIRDFFQAEQGRKEMEEEIELRKMEEESSALQTLNQAKAQAASRKTSAIQALEKKTQLALDALKAYQELESSLSEFPRPKEQLNTEYDPIERLRAMEGKLEEAEANLRLKTSAGYEKAYACASDAKQLASEILRRIEEYYQAQSEASSAIDGMNLGFSQLRRSLIFKNIFSVPYWCCTEPDKHMWSG